MMTRRPKGLQNPKVALKWLVFRYKERLVRKRELFSWEGVKDSMKNSWRFSKLCVRDSTSYPAKSILPGHIAGLYLPVPLVVKGGM